MIAASIAGRPQRLLVLGAAETAPRVVPVTQLVELVREGDVLVVNDAATLPASLGGVHRRTGEVLEVRLAARRSLDPRDPRGWDAIVLGAGDHRTPTERRSPPPAIVPEDVLELGPLTAKVERLLGHPRMIRLRFEGTPATIWQGLARHGRPIQYAHVPSSVRLWDTWTSIAGPPVAVEPPSAGFVLDWSRLERITARGATVVSLTHAAGLSSTGDAALDRRLPLPEPYTIGATCALAIARARGTGGRVVAIGTTVARALESAVDVRGRIRAGAGWATLRLGPDRPVEVVDVLVTGIHAPGTSHHELLGALVPDAARAALDGAAHTFSLREHEFGDAVWVERRPRAALAPDVPASPTAHARSID